MHDGSQWCACWVEFGDLRCYYGGCRESLFAVRVSIWECCAVVGDIDNLVLVNLGLQSFFPSMSFNCSKT